MTSMVRNYKQMAVSYCFITLCILAMSTGVGAQELEAKQVLGGKLVIQVPAELQTMPKELIEIKFPNSNRPTDVLSDSTGGVTLAFNHTQNVLSPNQIREAHGVISNVFKNRYPSATWFRDEVSPLNGQEFIIMELITPAIDTQIHNIIYATSIDNRLLFVAFNTTVEQSEQWLPVGKQIMASIQVANSSLLVE